MALTERDLESLDPLKLDREIARTAEAVRRWRRRLRNGEGLDEDPFWASRIVAGRTAFQVVSDLPETDPLRRPLVGWVYRLAEQRINRGALVHIAHCRKLAEHVVSEPEHARLSLSAMLDRALAEPARRAAWLGSFLSRCGALGESVATLWERRQEVAARMGLASPDVIESPAAGIVDLASRWLDRTKDMLDGGGAPTLDSLIGVALGEGAVEGWPRQLAPFTILDFFRGTDLFRGLDLDPGALPRARAPASYLRALARVGAAWTDATAPADQPFVIAHDPYGLRRRTMGALFGGLPAMQPFARRALGISGARLSDHLRTMGSVLLIESRAAALRVVLRSAALSGRRALREAFEAGVERAFDVLLRPDAAGALFRIHSDDPQRFAGLLLSGALGERLREEHEEDWYRNPRAVEQLRDEARVSPERTTEGEALARGEAAAYDALARVLG